LANKPDEDWSKEFNKALWAYQSNPSIYGTAPFEAAFKETLNTTRHLFGPKSAKENLRSCR